MTSEDKEIFKRLAYKNPYYDFYTLSKSMINDRFYDTDLETHQKRIELLRQLIRVFDAEKPMARKILKEWSGEKLKRSKWEIRPSQLK